MRPSSVGAAHHAAGINRLLVNKIRSRWPDTRIILRGDSGYAIERLMRWCDEHEVGYVFGLQKNNVLVREIACEMTRARIKQAQFDGKQACFRWFRYRTTKSWDRHRWVVGKAEYSGKGPNPRFVVTNLPSSEGIVDPIPSGQHRSGTLHRVYRDFSESPSHFHGKVGRGSGRGGFYLEEREVGARFGKVGRFASTSERLPVKQIKQENA